MIVDKYLVCRLLFCFVRGENRFGLYAEMKIIIEEISTKAKIKNPFFVLFYYNYD